MFGSSGSQNWKLRKKDTDFVNLSIYLIYTLCGNIYENLKPSDPKLNFIQNGVELDITFRKKIGS